MGKFIYTSENYEELCKSFSLIAEYINYNFPTLLLIINDNYSKANYALFILFGLISYFLQVSKK